MSTDRDYLAAGLALGGLSDAELAEARALSESDPDFRAEVAAYDEVMAETAGSDEPAEVSAAARAAILRIPETHEQETSAEVQTGRPAESSPEPASTSESAPPAEPVSLAERRERRGGRRSWLPYVAAAAVLIVVAGFGATIWQQNQRQNELEADLAATQQQLDESTRLMEATDLRTSTAELPEGGSVTVLSSESQQLIRLSPNDVGPAPSGKSMQMWVIGDSGPESVGLMSDKAVTIADEKFSAGSVFGITVEPEGGSKQPTTDPIVAIDL
ncbi:anti-sigma factor [Brevibacterium renqingii]|uniref:anti-sigma factor n=1 Tax=Brevibacterium renqingii TaxID=2776916 RepID=UPI001ADFF6A9|nr:anti-sigma factor [Brevibacterium renqingii]